MLAVLSMLQGGFPLLVEDADVSTPSQEEGGNGATPQATSHVQRSVAGEITAVQVAVSLEGRRGRGRRGRGGGRGEGGERERRGEEGEGRGRGGGRGEKEVPYHSLIRI